MTDEKKPSWQIFLESTGGTALITVLLGSLAGALITGMIQDNIKEKEFKNAFLNQYNTAQVEYVKGMMKTRTKVRKEAIDLFSEALNATQNLLQAKGPLNLGTKEAQKQVKSLKVAYNNTEDKWNENKYSIGFTLAYAYNSNPESIGWDQLAHEVDAFMDCAIKFTPPRNKTNYKELVEATDRACSGQRERVYRAMDNLATRLEEKSGESWAGFKNYQELADFLGL